MKSIAAVITITAASPTAANILVTASSVTYAANVRNGWKAAIGSAALRWHSQTMMLLMLSAFLASTTYSDFRITEPTARKITSTEYEKCMSRSLHNEEAVQCISDEWDHLDKVLNANYRTALAKAPNARAKKQLQTAQRQWLRSRYDECSQEDVGGPTPYDLAIHQCEIDELIRRIAWLRRFTS